MSITKYGDVGTPEILKHKGLKITLIDGQPKARVSKVSPVHTMYERGSITLSQFSAAKKLYECYITGWGDSGSCEIRERVDGCSQEKDITTRQIHAMREYARGKKACVFEWDFINKVVINEIPLTKRGDSERDRKLAFWHFRSGLNKLVKCYGM